MTKSAKTKLRKQNSVCWLAALILPLVLHFGLSHTKFPWAILLPILLLPLMLASNNLLAKAAGEPTDAAEPPKA
ncbi:MAG: hypothetical protein HZA92_09595 [Verrucomicrobia bacterium]|nr:hypothetical protein [Verrucomicrobiota bacterium]